MPTTRKLLSAKERERARDPLNKRRVRSIKERERRRDPLGVTRQSDIKELEAILRQQESGGYSRTYRK